MARACKKTVKIKNVRRPVHDSATLEYILEKKFGLSQDSIQNIRILRRSTDARQKRIDFVYTLAVTLFAGQQAFNHLLNQKDIEIYKEETTQKLTRAKKCASRCIIIGCGPAGLFAALTLVQRGCKPIVIEQGERIYQRIKTVDAFWNQGKLKPTSNTLFGEGGAGTFSDGKLTTRITTPLKKKVLEFFADAGADSEILYLSKPHLGTDRLRNIIPCMVDILQSKGATFLFNTRVSDIYIEDGHVTGVCADGNHMGAETVFLATGHSARDMFAVLHKRGIKLEAKPFAIGLRIEHPQEFIDKALLGTWAGNTVLGPADYFLACKDSKSRRGVFSFCMCPGGYIIGCSSSEDTLCTNGMSTYKRNSTWANAAVVTTVTPEDFLGSSVLKGIEFQLLLEKKAFSMGGKKYYAPAQRAIDFMQPAAQQVSHPVKSCSYRPGTSDQDLRKLLPDFLREPLQNGLKHFDKKIPGFISEGSLVGIETRTSSPVRVLRDSSNYNCKGIKGLIPIGEGSGYAGGIVSSAVDAIKAAMYFDG